MKSTKDIAMMLLYRYNKITKSYVTPDEMKLHKLMYFLQRQSYAITGKFIIEEDFEAWIHGPVLPTLRYWFEKNTIIEKPKGFTEEDIYIIDNTIYEYGSYETWYLRNLSHLEQSWINARKNLNENDQSSEKLKKEDIKKDAEKVRVYDYLYDMYLDEFEDLETYEK